MDDRLRAYGDIADRLMSAPPSLSRKRTFALDGQADLVRKINQLIGDRTLNELEVVTGIPRSTLSDIRGNRTPLNLPVLLELAAALGWTLTVTLEAEPCYTLESTSPNEH